MVKYIYFYFIYFLPRREARTKWKDWERSAAVRRFVRRVSANTERSRFHRRHSSISSRSLFFCLTQFICHFFIYTPYYASGTRLAAVPNIWQPLNRPLQSRKTAGARGRDLDKVHTCSKKCIHALEDVQIAPRVLKYLGEPPRRRSLPTEKRVDCPPAPRHPNFAYSTYIQSLTTVQIVHFEHGTRPPTASNAPQRIFQRRLGNRSSALRRPFYLP